MTQPVGFKRLTGALSRRDCQL